jgi:hypothetical protein
MKNQYQKAFFEAVGKKMQSKKIKDLPADEQQTAASLAVQKGNPTLFQNMITEANQSKEPKSATHQDTFFSAIRVKMNTENISYENALSAVKREKPELFNAMLKEANSK